ncbi:MAG: MFS transporter [Thermoprotei archaeon]|nr:MAG: MFS transporter [Thermoprotei archaeon]
MAPVLPLFIVSLGGGGLALGLIGGLGDGASSLIRLASGYLSDKLGRRKPLVAAGYLTSSASKLLMAFSPSWVHVLGLRVAERAGKGIRTPPRDALIAESAVESQSGRAFGLHRSLDTAGAVVGSLAAFLLVSVAGLGFREVILLSGVVAFIALLPLIPVKDVRRKPLKEKFASAMVSLPRRFKLLVPVTSLFAAGNVSYMFLLLRASGAFVGWLTVAAPLLLYILFNSVYAVLSYPMGALADRAGKVKVLASGYLLMSLVFALLYPSLSLPLVVAAFVVYGVSYAMIEGVERALVADACGELKGSGLGLYHASVGVAAIAGNLAAGLIWDYVGPAYLFIYASSLTLLSALLLAAWGASSSLKAPGS